MIRKQYENGIQYYIVDGARYPSVTSILSIIPRPELEAWRLSVGEEEADKIAAERAVIGSCIHYRILSKYSIRQLDPPKVYLPWKEMFEWLKEINYRCELAEMMWRELIANIQIEPLYVEHTLVSKRHKFAGTFDMLMKVNNTNVLMDLKTSKEIWEEHRLQLGAYAILCEENRIDVDIGMIVKIHPFEDTNPTLKTEVMWISKKELEFYGERFLDIVREFYNASDKEQEPQNL